MWNKIIVPIVKYIREALSEDKVGSYSRLSGILAILSSISWVTYLVIKNKALPDLGGVTIFITGANAAYVANQAKRAATAITGNGRNPDPVVSQEGQSG